MVEHQYLLDLVFLSLQQRDGYSSGDISDTMYDSSSSEEDIVSGNSTVQMLHPNHNFLLQTSQRPVHRVRVDGGTANQTAQPKHLFHNSRQQVCIYLLYSFSCMFSIIKILTSCKFYVHRLLTKLTF